jgi:hypothetical protein
VQLIGPHSSLAPWSLEFGDWALIGIWGLVIFFSSEECGPALRRTAALARREGPVERSLTLWLIIAIQLLVICLPPR